MSDFAPVTDENITPTELEILEEIAGKRPARPWGAHVGAAMEFLQESGYLKRNGALSDKGRAFLSKREAQTTTKLD